MGDRLGVRLRIAAVGSSVIAAGPGLYLLAFRPAELSAGWLALAVFGTLGVSLGMGLLAAGWLRGHAQVTASEPASPAGDEESVRSLVAVLESSAGSVLRAAERLSAASEQSSQAADGVAASVSQIAASVARQAEVEKDVRSTVSDLQRSIEETANEGTNIVTDVQRVSTQISDMSSALKQAAADAEEVAQQADRAVEIAREGGEVVGKAVGAMDEIREAVNGAAARIRDLGELSAQIGAITDVMANIAGRTNLLALNAAIEAARAGESGRGFSVVADEVRRLATSAADSASEINALIVKVQAQTAAAVEAMDLGTARVEVGSVLAANAGGALQQIQATVDQAATAVRGIAQAAVEVEQRAEAAVEAFGEIANSVEANCFTVSMMGAGASAVDAAMEQIAQASGTNADSAADVSAAVEELSASAAEVSGSAQELVDIAKGLHAQIERFRS